MGEDPNYKLGAFYMKIKSKLWFIALIALFILIFSACPNSPSGGTKRGGGSNTGGSNTGSGKQPTTETHNIDVPSTPEGLNNAGKKITVIFPLTGTTASERTTMKDRLTAAFGEFDGYAEYDPIFKAKMNPILNRAGNFKITVRVDANPFTAVVIEGNQMFLGSAWLLLADFGEVAEGIATAVLNDLIVAMDMSKETVRLAKVPEKLAATVLVKG